MIFLRFIVRPSDSPQTDSFGGTMAEFMFDESDPRECTRRAVVSLRNEGWRALSLADAQEGFTVSDFVGSSDFEALFDAAAENGMSYTFLTAELAGATR